MKGIISTIILSVFLSFFVAGQDGEQLYNQYCIACHQMSEVKTVGPGLLGIGDKRDKAWLKEWIKDSQAMINSGDELAIQVYENNNKMMMPPFSQLTDADLEALLEYMGVGESVDESTPSETTEATPPPEPIVFSEEDIQQGEMLFTGQVRFKNKGASCITCHNVNYGGIYGGLFAAELSDAHSRMGDLGLMGILSNPPFPAMVSSYKENPLTDEEIHNLTAFLMQVSEEYSTQVELAEKDETTGSIKAAVFPLLPLGLLGSLLVIGFIFLVWRKRKIESVKKDIFSRQKHI